mgnify:CR=1 FL=1
MDQLETWQAAVLGIVQGLSEPLPISSSGHLVVVPWLFDWPDPGGDASASKTFDVAVHLGTLFGVVIYFWRDLVSIVASAWRTLRTRTFETFEDRLPWYLILASIPAALVGAAFADTFEGPLSDPVAVGIQLIAFGLLLWVADRFFASERVMETLNGREALFIGFAQVLALIPGTSRSGITMTAGRVLKLRREAAARFSFLMSVPVVAGAVLFKSYDTFVAGDGLPDGAAAPFAAGIITSTVVGLFAIAFLLKYVRNHTLLPFVIYRCALGAVVLVVAATGLR